MVGGGKGERKMECKDIAISLIQRLLPIVTLKYITAICIFIILHILFVLLESVAQMYLTFWENKK